MFLSCAKESCSRGPLSKIPEVTAGSRQRPVAGIAGNSLLDCSPIANELCLRMEWVDWGGDGREASAIADELLRLTDPDTMATHSPAELQAAWEAISRKQQPGGRFPPVNGRRNHSSRQSDLQSAGSAASSRYEARKAIQSGASEGLSPRSGRSVGELVRGETRPPVAPLLPLAEGESIPPSDTPHRDCRKTKNTPKRKSGRHHDDYLPKRLSASSDDEDGAAFAPTEEQGLDALDSLSAMSSLYAQDSFENDEGNDEEDVVREEAEGEPGGRSHGRKEGPAPRRRRDKKSPPPRKHGRPTVHPRPSPLMALARPLGRAAARDRTLSKAARKRRKQSGRGGNVRRKNPDHQRSTTTVTTALPPVQHTHLPIANGTKHLQQQQRKAEAVYGHGPAGRGTRLPQLAARGKSNKAEPTPGGAWDVPPPQSLRGDARQAFGRVLRMAEEAEKAAVAALSPPRRGRDRARARARVKAQQKPGDRPRKQRRGSNSTGQPARSRERKQRARRMEARLKRLRRESRRNAAPLAQSPLSGSHSISPDRSPSGPRPFYAYSEDQRKRQEARNRARAKLGLAPMLPAKPRRSKEVSGAVSATNAKGDKDGPPPRRRRHAERGRGMEGARRDEGKQTTVSLDDGPKKNERSLPARTAARGGVPPKDARGKDKEAPDVHSNALSAEPEEHDDAPDHRISPEPAVHQPKEDETKEPQDSARDARHTLSSSSSENGSANDGLPEVQEAVDDDDDGGEAGEAGENDDEERQTGAGHSAAPSLPAEPRQDRLPPAPRVSGVSAESSYEEDFEELEQHDSTADKPSTPEESVTGNKSPEPNAEQLVPPLGVEHTSPAHPAERDSTARSSDVGDWF